MKEKSKVFESVKLVAIILCIVLSVAAIVVSSIAIVQGGKDVKLCNAYQIGLRQFLTGEVTETSISEIAYGLEDGDCDVSVVEELRGILKDASYQKAPQYKPSSAPGSGEFTTVYVTVTDVVMKDSVKYAISVCNDFLGININGGQSYYYSNVCQKVIAVLDDAVLAAFPDYFNQISY